MTLMSTLESIRLQRWLMGACRPIPSQRRRKDWARRRTSKNGINQSESDPSRSKTLLPFRGRKDVRKKHLRLWSRKWTLSLLTVLLISNRESEEQNQPRILVHIKSLHRQTYRHQDQLVHILNSWTQADLNSRHQHRPKSSKSW